MSESYYRQNRDYFDSAAIRGGTPRNAVLEVVFSDVQSSNGQPGGLHTLVYTATGDETGFQDDLLINATVIALSRDGLEYTPVEEFSATPKKEFLFTSATGEIEFHPGLPPMMPDEDAVVQYVAEGETPVGVTEPVTLAQAKAWLKVEVDDDDAIITALITAARQICEGYSGISFVARTITAIVKNELGNIRLPYGPVNAITGMSDEGGNEIATTSYSATGETSKRIRYPVSSYLSVTYTAGYAALPKQFVTAVLMQLTWCYMHRGDAEGSTISPEAKIILSAYRCIV